jgi:hypothetical protein
MQPLRELGEVRCIPLALSLNQRLGGVVLAVDLRLDKTNRTIAVAMVITAYSQMLVQTWSRSMVPLQSIRR